MSHQLDLFSEATLAHASALLDEVSPSDASEPHEGARAAPSNFSEAIELYQDAASDHPRRVTFRSALKRVAKALRLPPEQVPTAPNKLRPLLARAKPAAAGMKPSNWKTAKSAALAALRELRVEVEPSRSASPLSEDWTELIGAVEDRGLAIGLSRVLRHFSGRAVSPAKVTVECFEEFRLTLTERSLLQNAEGAYRQSIRNWNKAVATVPGWPQLRVPQQLDPRRFSYEWHELPPAFVADVEGFLAAKSNTDPLSDDYARPTRAATTEGRRSNLRVLASALLLSQQVQLRELTSLEVLTRPDSVRAALRYLRDERSNGAVTEAHINRVWLCRTIAKHWLKDESRTEELKVLIANLTAHVRKGAGRGMTRKNRERLLQFVLPQNVDLLVGLPHKIFRSARGLDPTYRDAVRVMYALQVGILTFVPLRARNLTELELATHVIDVGKGSKRGVRLHLPGAITKTHRDFNAPLPKHLFPLLDGWINVYRKKICPEPSPYLFPNPSGDLRSREALTNKLQKFIRRETGLIINAHLFRHIAAKLYLDYDPSGIEIVRQLLGHKSVKTTLAVYAELQTDPAFRRMEHALLNVGYSLSAKSSRPANRVIG